MADTVATAKAAQDFSSRSLRLDTLVRLRWLAVGGQTLAVLFVRFALDFPLPTTVCLLLIGLSAGLNLVLRARFPATLRLGQWPAFALLAYDVLQLGVLLFLTGGLENPFAMLLLAPVIVSAAALAPRPTVLLGSLVVAVASALALFHWRLPWYPAETLPLLYVGGVWVALVFWRAGVVKFSDPNGTSYLFNNEYHVPLLSGSAAAFLSHKMRCPSSVRNSSTC